MNSHPIPAITADEVDAFGRSKNAHAWAPGQRKAIKKGYNGRVRRAGKAEIRREAW